MTKCRNNIDYCAGGGILLKTEIESQSSSATVVLSHLILSQNSAGNYGGNLAAVLYGSGKVTLTISNCLFSHGHTYGDGIGGGMYFDVSTQSSITVQNTELMENEDIQYYHDTSELYYESSNSAYGSLSLINSTIVHTETHSDYGVRIIGCCPDV